MSTTHRRVAYFKAIDQVIGLFAVVDSIFEVIEMYQILKIGFIRILEFLDNGSANRFATHIHGDESGREEWAVFVAVDFLEYQTQYGGIYEGAFIVLYPLSPFRCKIVRLQKLEQILQGR